MPNEQTNEADTQGKETDTPVEKAEETKELNPLLIEAKSLAERIEEGNKKSEELLKKQEQLLADQTLSGQGGGRVEEKPHVETEKEYSDRIKKEIAEGKHND